MKGTCASVQGWGDGQAPGFSGSGVASCSLPPARGGLGGGTSSFPAQCRFAGASEGRERRQGWPSSESKPPQSLAPQREPGPISQREIGSQFRQLGEVTLRLALSLSAVLGSCPLLTFSRAKARDAAGAPLRSSERSRPWSTPDKSRISTAEWDPGAGKEPYSSDRAVSIAPAASSLSCKNLLPGAPQAAKTRSPRPAALPSPPQNPQQFAECLKPWRGPIQSRGPLPPHAGAQECGVHGLRPAKTFELPPLRGPESPSRAAERQTRAAATAEPERGGGNQNSFKMKPLGKTQSSPPTGSDLKAFEHGDRRLLSGCAGKVGRQLLALTRRRQLAQVQSILKEGKGGKLVKTPTQPCRKQRNLFCNVPMLSGSYAHHGTMSAGAQCQWLGHLPQDMARLPLQWLLTVVLDASPPCRCAVLLWKEKQLV